MAARIVTPIMAGRRGRLGASRLGTVRTREYGRSLRAGVRVRQARWSRVWVASTAEEDWASELDMLAAASGMADAEEARRPEPAPAVEGGSSFDDARVFLRQTVGIKSDNECAVVWDVLTNPNSIFTRRVEQPRLSRKAREKNAKKKTKAQTFKPRAVSVEQPGLPQV